MFFGQNTSYFAGFGSQSSENLWKIQSKPSPKNLVLTVPKTPLFGRFEKKFSGLWGTLVKNGWKKP
jgi:hypothetical protein